MNLFLSLSFLLVVSLRTTYAKFRQAFGLVLITLLARVAGTNSWRTTTRSQRKLVAIETNPELAYRATLVHKAGPISAWKLLCTVCTANTKPNVILTSVVFRIHLIYFFYHCTAGIFHVFFFFLYLVGKHCNDNSFKVRSAVSAQTAKISPRQLSFQTKKLFFLLNFLNLSY